MHFERTDVCGGVDARLTDRNCCRVGERSVSETRAIALRKFVFASEHEHGRGWRGDVRRDEERVGDCGRYCRGSGVGKQRHGGFGGARMRGNSVVGWEVRREERDFSRFEWNRRYHVDVFRELVQE